MFACILAGDWCATLTDGGDVSTVLTVCQLVDRYAGVNLPAWIVAFEILFALLFDRSFAPKFEKLLHVELRRFLSYRRGKFSIEGSIYSSKVNISCL